MMSAGQTHRFVMICHSWHMINLWQRGAVFPAPSVNAMRLLSAITCLTLFAVPFAADAAPLPAPHQVDIPLSSGVLHAQLYKPDGNGPFPVVIALHGCGGLTGHSEPVLPRYRDWAEQLLKDGNAV